MGERNEMPKEKQTRKKGWGTWVTYSFSLVMMYKYIYAYINTQRTAQASFCLIRGRISDWKLLPQAAGTGLQHEGRGIYEVDTQQEYCIAASVIHWGFYTEKAPNALWWEAEKGTVTKSEPFSAHTGIPEVTWGNAYHNEQPRTWEKWAKFISRVIETRSVCLS